MTPYPEPSTRTRVQRVDLAHVRLPDLYGIDCLGLADLGEGVEWLALVASKPDRRIVVVSRSDHCPTPEALRAAYPELDVSFPFPSPGHHRIHNGLVELHLMVRQPWSTFDGHIDAWWGPEPELPSPKSHFHRPVQHGMQHIAVIGAGISGVQTAKALTRRGATVSLFDPAPASGASGNAQGMVYVSPQREPTPASRFWLQCYEHALRAYQGLPHFHPTGLFCMAENAEDEAALQALLAAIRRPASHVHYLDRNQASCQLGAPARFGGSFWPGSGWVAAADMVRSEADALGCRHERVTAINEHDSGVTITTATGLHEFEGVVLATANAVQDFAPPWLKVNSVRGQISRRRSSDGITSAICGEGYLTPPDSQGWASFGASFNPKDASTDLRHQDDIDNDRRVADLIGTPLPGEAGESRASVRCASPDYLPICGRLPGPEWAEGLAKLRVDAKWRPDQPMDGWRRIAVNVGHGSRGLTSTPLCGDIVAADMTGEPLPVGRDLFEHITPARFLIRALKRNQL